MLEHEFTPPRSLLARSLDGTPLEKYTNEAGRNFFLQIRAAIYFMRVGYDVELTGDCDLLASRKRCRIFVECKRLYSEKKAAIRVHECYQQLGKRLAASDSKCKNLGLAWIDPSPAMQQHYFFYTAYSQEGLRDAARMDIQHFWRKWIVGKQGKADKRIFAWVLQMISPGWAGESQMVSARFTSFVVPGHGKTGIMGLLKARRLLDEIWRVDTA